MSVPWTKGDAQVCAAHLRWALDRHLEASVEYETKGGSDPEEIAWYREQAAQARARAASCERGIRVLSQHEGEKS